MDFAHDLVNCVYPVESDSMCVITQSTVQVLQISELESEVQLKCTSKVELSVPPSGHYHRNGLVVVG